MEPGAASKLKKTPLHSVHRALGARMVDFGGWDMPVEYSGIIAEHLAVRNSVGLFDVSHMGEIEVRGPQALFLVNLVTCNDAAKLKLGQAQYSGLLNGRGGFLDDTLVHRIAEDHFFFCANASNQESDYQWILDQNRWDAEVEFASEQYVQLAIQGPQGPATLQKLTGTDLSSIRYYWFVQGHVCGKPAIIAHTGYTGSDGFEIYIPPEEGERIWNEVLEAGKEFGILPCGLGARNTLRLEAAMSLYGHELTEEITPYEAGLDWIVKLDQGDFIGREALVHQKEAGVQRRIAGFEMRGRGIARDGYRVFADGKEAGWVTSGAPAPYLKKNIGLAMLPVEAGEAGNPIEIEIRGRMVEAETAPIPFYSRKKKG